MKKKSEINQDEPRAEYHRSDFGKMERGKYYQRVKTSSNIVVLDADVASAFPDSESVNRALHALMDAARSLSVKS